MKIFLKFLLGIFILLVILAIICAILITRTPRQLKIEDKQWFGEDTFETLGLADTKFTDMYKSLKKLTKAKEDEIVQNGFNLETEKENVSALTQDSNYEKISSLLKEKIEFEEDVMAVYKDTTLAYMLDDALQKTDDSKIKDLGASVEELTIKKDGSCRFVFSFEVPVNDLPNIPAVKYPNKIYAVGYFNISANDEGVMTVGAKDLKISDEDDPIIDLIITAILKKVYPSEEVPSEERIKKLQQDLAVEISKVLNNLGKLGYTDETTDGSEPLTVGIKKIDISTVKYGMAGFPQDGYITIIGYTSDTE
ncbi:MAG TPA: hypothetical protein GX709_01665 [Clostridiales bacterium]|nr:hypothetical protein [Clostridiales bacterium]